MPVSIVTPTVTTTAATAAATASVVQQVYFWFHLTRFVQGLLTVGCLEMV